MNTDRMKKLGLLPSFTIYASAALLMLLVTKFLIPFLSRSTGIETVFFWFIAGGLCVFAPLFLAAAAILRSEGYSLRSGKTWSRRLRFRKLNFKDILLSLLGLLVAGGLSAGIMEGLVMLAGEFEQSPSFMAFEPLDSGRYWLLLAWLPYWILNILGEELLWRGVMLPRQELAFGKKTWLIHGTGWLLFHIAFGWQLMLTLVPLMFILPFVAQKTGNTWNGVIMHAGLNGPSFIAIAFGIIQ